MYVNSDDPRYLRVIAAEYDLKVSDSPRQVIDVAAVIIHPSYDSNTQINDIAIFKLAKPIVVTDEARPVVLAADTVPDDTVCVATGWGDTQCKSRPTR